MCKALWMFERGCTAHFQFKLSNTVVLLRVTGSKPSSMVLELNVSYNTCWMIKNFVLCYPNRIFDGLGDGMLHDGVVFQRESLVPFQIEC